MAVVIGGFSPDDKVPGFYGQVQYGTAGQSFAGLPIALLLVGLITSAGTLTYDTQVQQVFQDSDLDTLAGIGGELANMGYAALNEQSDIPIFIASAKPPSGASAATCTVLVGGTWTVGGTIGVRIAGFPVTVNVGSTDTIATVCTNLAAAINGANEGRLPFTATATSTTVVITCATPGIRGDQYVIFLEPNLPTSGVVWPSGMTLSLTGVTWSVGGVATATTYVVPTVANGYYYKVTTVGSPATFASPQPTWPTTIGTATTADSNGNIFTCWGAILNGGAVNPGGGSGLETYTNLLNTLANQGYGRIALAANDATSAAAWLTQINTDAGPLIGFLQHAVVSFNSTTTTAVSMAQTTLNNQRFQVCFEQSSEDHTSVMSAVMAADRAFWEQSDPDKNYDYDTGFTMPALHPQTQVADQAIHSVQVALLNTGVTPFLNVNNTVRVCRAITSHCLNGSNPDYSTLDVGFAVVPDFVLMYMRGVWAGWQQANVRLRGPLAQGEPKPPSGVGYPDLWNSTVTSNLMLMEQGTIPGTCPPILYDVENFLPITDLDPTTVGRLMTACPVNVMPDTHQVGVSVQQV